MGAIQRKRVRLLVVIFKFIERTKTDRNRGKEGQTVLVAPLSHHPSQKFSHGNCRSLSPTKESQQKESDVAKPVNDMLTGVEFLPS